MHLCMTITLDQGDYIDYFNVTFDLITLVIVSVCFFPVAPDAIYSHVKTYKQEARNMHYVAPEYGGRPLTWE